MEDNACMFVMKAKAWQPCSQVNTKDDERQHLDVYAGRKNAAAMQPSENQ